MLNKVLDYADRQQAIVDKEAGDKLAAAIAKVLDQPLEEGQQILHDARELMLEEQWQADLAKLEQGATVILGIIQKERSGVRDGDGCWHGSDALGALPQEARDLTLELERALERRRPPSSGNLCCQECGRPSWSECDCVPF
jgi:hypothetical protein